MAYKPLESSSHESSPGSLQRSSSSTLKDELPKTPVSVPPPTRKEETPSDIENPKMKPKRLEMSVPKNPKMKPKRLEMSVPKDKLEVSSPEPSSGPLSLETESNPADSVERWKPLPPRAIDSILSRTEQKAELKTRRYSEALGKYLLAPDNEREDYYDFKVVYEKVEQDLNWKEMQSRRKYYTYVLVDPRSEGGSEPTGFEAFIRGVFYIGKGCGSRCAFHFFKEEPKGTCQVCKRKQVDLEDNMKTIAHKCCKSPTFNSVSVCEKCGAERTAEENQEESSSHTCLGSGEYPEMTTCPDCQKMCQVKDGKFESHVSDWCKAPRHLPKEGKCEDCNQDRLVLEDRKIPDHKCDKSPRYPEKVKCIICEELIEWKKTNIKHECCKVPEDCKQGTCKTCKELFDLETSDKGRILVKAHNCPGSRTPEKVKCIKCEEKIEWRKRDNKHECCKVPGDCKQGTCKNCKELFDLETSDNGKIKVHNCPASRIPEKGECQKCNELIPLTDRKIPAHPDCDSPQDPIKGECKVCKKQFMLNVKKIPAHQGCNRHGSPQDPKKGVCITCGSLADLSLQKEKLKYAVKGSTLKHKVQCPGSEKALEEVMNDIKDKKIISIWEEVNKTPTAVVCSQFDTDLQSRQKEAMMIMAYGKDNVSNTERRADNYVQGKLVNKRIETVSGRSSVDDSDSLPQYGVSLLIDAWKTYKIERTNKDKPPCAARIMWPSNPKEVDVLTRDDDEGDSEE